MNASVSQQPDIATRLRDGFPAALSAAVTEVLQVIPSARLAPSTDDIGPIRIAGKQLRIPRRFYSDVPANFAVGDLEPTQQTVLSCIYTRHHIGYVRQEFTGHLLSNSPQPWAVPLLLQLVGEYVCEIHALILTRMHRLDRALVLQFATENSPFIELTRHRVISYWNVYYRSQFPDFSDYPGYRAMDAFGLWCNDVSPRLLSR